MSGRELPPSSPFATDDGTADPGVAAALQAFAAGSGSAAEVVASLAGTRVLVPVLAELDAAGTVEVDGHSHTVDKEASAGIVALQAPDGRTALPVFSSVAAMSAWRREARPVPTDVARAALSAVDEGWELMVLDAGGPATVLLPRPAVWALAQQQPWRPAVVGAGQDRRVDDDVRAAVRAAVTGVPGVGRSGKPALSAAPGRWARLLGRRRPGDHGSHGPDDGTRPGPGAAATQDRSAGLLLGVDAVPGRRAEVAVELRLAPGLPRPELDRVLALVGQALAADDVVTRRVDSVELRLR